MRSSQQGNVVARVMLACGAYNSGSGKYGLEVKVRNKEGRVSVC